MEKIIIDTSVAVKWFLKEEGTTEATDLIRAYKNGQMFLIAPDILKIETLNALYFKGFLEQTDLTNVIKVFRSLHIKFKMLDQYLLLNTEKIMKEHKLAAYDAAFIALAEQEKCPLITADKKHHRREISSYITYL